MRRRTLFLAACGLGLVLIGLAGGQFLEGWFAPQLKAAAEAEGPGRISVGKNVHLSAASSEAPHQGCTIVADPSNPLRLCAASMISIKLPTATAFGIVGYISQDGGSTWRLAYERSGKRAGEACCDEALAFGPDGELYAAHMRGRFANRSGEAPSDARTELLVSRDGGTTWEDRGVIEGLVDRPQLAVDVSNNPFRGRLYCNANVLLERKNLAAVYVSKDQATSFRQPPVPDAQLPTVYNSNPVVLGDGTIIVAYTRGNHNASAPPQIMVWRSSNGGESFEAAMPVRTAWRHPRARSTSGVTMYPRLAADPASNRLYCIWQDGKYILFGASNDRGISWTDPVLLSEQPIDRDDSQDYYCSYPAVAVNKRGHVAVLWYDRRSLPAQTAGRDGAIKRSGYNLRLRASLDGGRAWLPSVQVNEATGKGDPSEIRFWIGLAANADGQFHPAWISDTSGTLQLWTAVVTVEAR